MSNPSNIRSTSSTRSTPSSTTPSFASLKFDPSRTVLYVYEVAAKLRVTDQHVIDLIDEGKLRAVNIGGKGTSGRKFYRIPIDSYNAYLTENLL